MSLTEPFLAEKECIYVLVTGANSGLGFAICCRLVDEFLALRLHSRSLHLIITTRDKPKGKATLTRLHKHLLRHPTPASKRVSFQAEQVDLVALRSIKSLSQSLLNTLPKLDVVILNAGIGGFTGINWPSLIWNMLTDFFQALTYPTYKLSGIGITTPPQTNNLSTTNPPHPPLANVFCANVFGHYLLTHQLHPLLSPSSRIIWISSLEAIARTFNSTDLQGLSSPQAYESSKRLTDILALTSSLPSTRDAISRFLPQRSQRPQMYLAHPGICATAIFSLPLLMHYLMILTMYLVRSLGSPWHTVRPYVGACAPVWLALTAQEELDAVEAEGKAKWGSSADRTGNARVIRTEVEGYGVQGESGAMQEFGELGRECWRQMEELRGEWEERIKD